MVNTLQAFHSRDGELELPRHVAIVGQAPRQWQDYAGAEVWVCNGPAFPPIWHVLWQLHGWEHIDRRHGTRDRALIAEIDDIGRDDRDHRRLFMPAINKADARTAAPGAEFYPIEALSALVGRYLTGSIPVMVAHAVEVGVSRITLDGMRFTPHAQDWWASGEGWMIPCTEWHLGRAQARGISVEHNHGSGLFRGDGWVYGFEGPGSV
jgi:hypothetical protein